MVCARGRVDLKLVQSNSFSSHNDKKKLKNESSNTGKDKPHKILSLKNQYTIPIKHVHRAKLHTCMNKRGILTL